MKKGKAYKTILLSGLLVILTAGLSLAQQFPTKPINILVAFAPGGSNDLSARLLASKAQKFLGQPFVISNNGTGAGSVALRTLANEKPNGYQLVSCTSAFITSAPHFRAVPYKPQDFIPILNFVAPRLGMVVKANSPWKTLKEFLEYAKKNPDTVSYSTGGVGTSFHIAMEYVAKHDGIRWIHVPYPGSMPAVTAILGGHVNAALATETEWGPHVKEGTLRFIGALAPTRLKNFPDVPTFKELGYDVVSDSLYILIAPKGTPLPIVKKLDEAFHKAMDDAEFTQTMDKLGMEVGYLSSEDTAKYLQEAYIRIGKRIVELNIAKEPEKK